MSDVPSPDTEPEDPLAEIRESFLVWLEAEISTIETLATRANESTESWAALLPQIYKSGHDMKGLGASFGYEHLTAAGDSLCRYVKAQGAAHASPDASLILDHCRLMRASVQAGGGAEAMLAELKTRVAAVLG